MYLNHTLVLESFKRLRTNNLSGKKGKTPMERTSSLMIMLALDIMTKRYGVQTLDVDFSKSTTKTVRHAFGLEYEKLVSVMKADDGSIQSVHELGFVHVGGKDPAQRMSSNFLTTHVVSATKSETEFEYPHRPAPLLQLGKVATGLPYGIQLHPEWQSGMMEHLGDVSSNTPFTDLAMFCLRFDNAEQKESLTKTLTSMLHEKFSKDMADFWSSKIKVEKVFAKHLKLENFMEEQLVDSLATMNNAQNRRAELMKYDKAQLVEIILRGEGFK